jgi:lysophospholipase L1-like esterase
VARTLDRLWLVRGLRKLLFFYTRPRVAPPATGPESRTGQFADFRPTVFEGNLHAIVDEVRRLGARPLIATLPTVVRMDMTADDILAQNVYFPYYPSAYAVGDFLDLVDAYNLSILRVAAEENVPVADLAGTFQRIPDVSDLFRDTLHMTRKGHELVAATIHDTLERHGLEGPEGAGS